MKNLNVKLFEDHELCDASLIARDGTTIPVHKLVLATCSEYFKAAFYGRFASSTSLKLDYEVDILTAIKKYCYTDSIDHPLLCRSGECHAAKGRFLVQLVRASDYLLLPDLFKRLLVSAHGAMTSRQSCCVVPFIYSEARALGVVELEKLAWHAYWMWQCSSQGINTDIPFEAADPEAEYRQGLILVLRGSADIVNGQYYCARRASFTTFLKKDKAEKGGLEIVMRICEYDNDMDALLLRLSHGNETDTELHDKRYAMYTAYGTCKTMTKSLQWTMVDEHKQKLRRAETPPISFYFRIY